MIRRENLFAGDIKRIFRGEIVLKERERERGLVGKSSLYYELLEEIEAISGRRETLSAIKSIESRRWEKNGRH